MKSYYIRAACVSFLVGVFVFSLFPCPPLIIGSIVCWSVVVRGMSKSVGIVLLFFALGLFRYWLFVPQFDQSSVHYYRNEHTVAVIEGVIIEDPDRRREKVNYTVAVETICFDTRCKEVQGRIMASHPLYPGFAYNQRIRLTGLLVSPPEFEGFSYKNYLSLSGVYSIMQRPGIVAVEDPHFSIKGILFSVKDAFEFQLNRLFPEPAASFEAGLLTGSRKGIPDDLLEAFNMTGLTHIIAISGYNISLIIILISSLFKNASRRVKVPFIIVFIVLFTIFVGASAAVVRASIMGIISVMALWFGRQSHVMNALLMSAFVMVVWNPVTLLYDVGFQLSFLATLGLVVSGNTIMKLARFLPETYGIREAFAMTLSAQIFALPIILVNFGRFSLISPVANVLIVPLIPFAMFFGFVSVVASVLYFNLGFIIALPAWFILEIASYITMALAKLPLAAFEVPWFTYVHVFFYYLLCLFAYFIYPYFRSMFTRTGRLNMRRFPVANMKGVRDDSGSRL
ncbi:DUF4131 domain-containing protein [Candidatus Peregrinibacteria bacterium]|nr:DUF4131 domain-containing protein [Candidatus Peregrinibacteria bacterium]